MLTDFANNLINSFSTDILFQFAKSLSLLSLLYAKEAAHTELCNH